MWDIGEASVVSRSLVKEIWREGSWNEDVRVCGGGADVVGGSSVVLDVTVSWILSGRLRRGGGGGRVAVWCSDLERVGRAEEDVMNSGVSFVGLRSGWVGGAGRWDEPSGVVIERVFPGRVGSRVGRGGRKRVGVCVDWMFKLALATWSMDGKELDVDDGELGVRRRGSGGAGHVSSDSDEPSPLRNCFVGLRLRVLLLAEEPDDVVLSTCRTRSRSSCSSTRFKS
jgi:hypothetical protein